MAEYIDREKLYKDLLFGDDDDYIEAYSKGMIEEAPTADVVERPEYEKLLKENMRIDDALHAANQDALKYIEECRKLRFRVNEAIEEIKEVSFKHHFELGEYVGEITETWEVVKLDHVLDILKRNIGEE